MRVPATVLTMACCLWTAWAGAQQLEQESMQEMGIDPISFTGPDPAEQYEEVFIEQKLNAQIPLDLTFTDSTGKAVQLADYFNRDKPVVLSLVYYECPMLCTQVLNGMVSGFDGKDNTGDIGTDYDVLSVSINPAETPELAAEKKASYLTRYNREGGEAGWHFLTGTEENIETLAQAVGFRYFYDAQSKQYAHASGIMIMTPEGRVSTYYLGIEYLPRNLEVSLDEAKRKVIGSLKDQLILLCYQYDPTTGRYGFLILGALQIGGGLTVAAIAAFWVVSFLSGRKARAAGGEDLDVATAQNSHG